MLEFFSKLFDSDFIPHGHCYFWSPGVLWLNVTSDAAIVAAYYTIPFALLYFVYKKPATPFRWMFVLFGAFIFSCGTTHLMEIWTVWNPTYRLQGVIKLITGAISLATASLLVPLLPRALALPSPAQLRQVNERLEREAAGRQHALAILRESEERFRSAFDYAAIGMGLVSPDGRWFKVNRALCEIIGYPEPELLKTDFQSITHPDDLEADLVFYRELMTGKRRSYQMEKRYLHYDGHVVWIQLAVSLLRDPDGEPLYTIAQIQDITERRRAEEAVKSAKQDLEARVDERTAELSRSNALLRAEVSERQRVEADLRIRDGAIAATRNGIFITDPRQPDNPVIYCNRAAEKISGYGAAEILGRNCRFLQRDDRDQEALADVRAAVREGHECRVVLRNYRNDGTLFWNELDVSPVRDETGRLTHFVGVLDDISARKRAEAERSQLASIVEWSDDAIISKDLDNVILSWNKGAEKIYGYSAAEMVGMPISVLVPAGHAEELREIMDDLKRGKRVDHSETVRMTKSGGRIHVSLTVSPIKDARGKVIGSSTIARDITERTLSEQRKNEFLALLGHELRNPLGAITSSLAIIESRDSGDGAVREAVAILKRQSEHMARLVDDLLDLARITQGQIELKKCRVDLGTLVDHAVKSTQRLFASQDRRLSVTLPAESVILDADPDRLEQILDNLLSNAAKYTDPGGHVWLSAERGNDEVVIRVRDDGIGMDPQLIPDVFDLFTQQEHTVARSRGGLGIGLTLVRRLTQMHRGTVEARSEGPGTGSEFTIRLPALRQAPAPREQPSMPCEAAPRQGKRVLLVDDERDIATTFSILAQGWGHEVHVAHDGESAIAEAIAYQPDVVVVDIGLPDIDGWEVARRLRQQPALERALLIALTGYGQEQDRVRSREAGFDLHLVKPVKPDALRQILLDR